MTRGREKKNTMAMFYYKNKPEEKNVGGWTSRIVRVEDRNRLAVTHIDETYYVDGFYNNSGLVLQKTGGEEDVWYSFDPIKGNFHIVPADTQLFGPLGSALGMIRAEYQEIAKKKGLRVSFGRGCARNQRWVETTEGNYGYLFSFNRLWCDNNHHIHNNFGQVQFMRYPIADGQINLVNGGFQMMYPACGGDYSACKDCDKCKKHTKDYHTKYYKATSGHISYNAPFELKTIVGENGTIDFKSDKTKMWAEEIAKAFANFIEDPEEQLRQAGGQLQIIKEEEKCTESK